MKLPTIALTLLASVLSATAQSAFIRTPANGSAISRGTNTTVQVTKPNSLTGSTSVALAIGLRSCEPSTTSPSPSCLSIPSDEFFGYVAYTGPFAPVYHETALPPYQNLTVYVPQGFAQGTAVLSIAHFVLVGAGPETILDVSNVTVTVV
ncbi:hypothetical protein BDY19DRAFT_907780 [Irpex rosettiformis]|uniref:Uncharacterized protein n=1 Tax=Irpex rosettiformis TaxID=378272 RepID=A0ACB8TY07_9APHY|nr:hypothetical protein BDY19DRAFT_907780 [Irpex rosettiformis]